MSNSCAQVVGGGGNEGSKNARVRAVNSWATAGWVRSGREREVNWKKKSLRSNKCPPNPVPVWWNGAESNCSDGRVYPSSSDGRVSPPPPAVWHGDVPWSNGGKSRADRGTEKTLYAVVSAAELFNGNTDVIRLLNKKPRTEENSQAFWRAFCAVIFNTGFVIEHQRKTDRQADRHRHTHREGRGEIAEWVSTEFNEYFEVFLRI